MTLEAEFTSTDFVSIRGGRQSAKYYFSDPEITLKSAPEKNVNFPGADIQFTLSAEDLLALQKASAVYGLPDLTFPVRRRTRYYQTYPSR